MANILIVDDSEPIRIILGDALARNGHHTAQAESGEKAIALVREDVFDMAIVDLRMGEVDGLDLLKVVRDISPDTQVIMITGYATVGTAVEAMKLGAYDFATKPINIEELLLIIDRAMERRELVGAAKALQTQVEETYRFPDIVGGGVSIEKSGRPVFLNL